jgi:hypothetical protein
MLKDRSPPPRHRCAPCHRCAPRLTVVLRRRVRAEARFSFTERADMPNLKTLSLRLKSVTSTSKITKAMKMVAASKLRGAEAKMRAARPFASSINELMSIYLEPKDEDTPETKALMAISSDKGLCGGINSRVVKAIKQIYDAEAAVYPVVRRRFPPAARSVASCRRRGRMFALTSGPTILSG